LTSTLSRRLLRLEQRRQLSRLSPPQHTIVFVDADGTRASAIRWSIDEHRWIDVPVPAKEASE
jgi:hypothetical protein